MLEFWFEFASPYSYVAAMQIGPLCREYGVGLQWKSFLLGPIFEMQGWNTSHFNLNPWRGNYMWRDLERLTAKFGLPWKRSSTFPKNCVLASRVAAANAGEQWIEAYVREAFIANFGDDRDLNDEDTVLELLSHVGCDAGSVLRSTLLEPARSELRRNTERAMQNGLFGAPNCLVGDELFWGEESLEDAVDWARRHANANVVHDSHIGMYAGPEL